VAALGDYERGPFTEREKVALRYADRMYEDHHKVDDALWADLRGQFSDDEALELSWAIAEFIALGKIIYVLDMPYGIPTRRPGKESPSRVLRYRARRGPNRSSSPR